MRAYIAFILLLHPLLRPDFTPPGHSAQDDLFPYRNREVINELAGEVRALKAAFKSFISAAGFYGAGFTKAENTL
jgi:hypothetical protein